MPPRLLFILRALIVIVFVVLVGFVIVFVGRVVVIVVVPFVVVVVVVVPLIVVTFVVMFPHTPPVQLRVLVLVHEDRRHHRRHAWRSHQRPVWTQRDCEAS